MKRFTVFFRSWWMFGFLAMSYFLYSHAMKNKERVFLDLQHKLHELEMEKQLVLEEKEDLLLQIKSQSDPEWIEMTLMKGLGLVPEGAKKVYFEEG